MWKNLQKKEIKKKISEIINKIIPIFIFKNTLNEWSPWNVLSRITSRHHWNIIINVDKKNKNNKLLLLNLLWEWNKLIKLNNNSIVLIALNKGHIE